ncbi:MAG TPA: AI-2E family transporter [Caldimonas sp.]|nr:AI-2E family transporter [Caldimonas sp.]
MNPQILRALVVLALAAAGLHLLHNLITPILWAGLIAIATWPLHERLVLRRGARFAPWSALFLTAAVVCVFVVPFAYVVLHGWHEAPALLHLWTSSQESGLPAPPWLGGVPFIGPWLVQIWNDHLESPGALSAFVHSLGGEFDLARGRTLAALVAHDAMKFFFCIVVLFFLYLDGAALAAQIGAVVLRQLGAAGLRTLPLVVRSVRGAVNGLVLVGVGVALLMTLACIAAGVPHPAAIGLATGVLGMVPFGAMLVLVLVVVYLLAVGATVSALVLLAFGATAIFIADHFVRPKFMSAGTRLPLVLALLGIVGGLETFGVLGLFLGPTLLAILVAIWRELAAPEAEVAS